MSQIKIERKDLFEEVVTWPATVRTVVGVIGIPLISCYTAILPLALGFGHIKLLTDGFEVLVVAGISALACPLFLWWPNNRLLRWIPALILFLLQSFLIMAAKPVNEWVYGLPIYTWSVGAPILTAILFALYCRKIGLVESDKAGPRQQKK